MHTRSAIIFLLLTLIANVASYSQPIINWHHISAKAQKMVKIPIVFSFSMYFILKTFRMQKIVAICK